MYFLLLNILFSSCFILCVKWVQNHRKMDIVTVGSLNYIAAAICAVPGFVSSEASPAVAHAVWTGAAMGGCYFVAFFFLIYAVRWVGASNSAAVSRVSLVIPVCAGIGLWGELPDFFQAIGIATAFVSLLMIGKARANPDPKTSVGTHASPVSQGWVLVVLSLPAARRAVHSVAVPPPGRCPPSPGARLCVGSLVCAPLSAVWQCEGAAGCPAARLAAGRHCLWGPWQPPLAKASR